MKRNNTFWAITFYLTLTMSDLVNSRRILFLLPIPSYSHQMVYRSLSLALHERGHELVVLTANPMNSTLENYSEIDFSDSYEIVNDQNINWQLPTMENMQNWKLIHNLTERALKHPKLVQIYNAPNDKKFDLIILEFGSESAFYALAHKLRAPTIGIVSSDIQNGHRYAIGSQLLPSHPSNWELEGTTGFNLPFFQRVKNFVCTWWYVYRWYVEYVQPQNEIARKYFGRNIPHVSDLAKNTSLVLMNHPLGISFGRPEPPNIMYFTGMHIKKVPPALPTNVKAFLDKAREGFIYVSFGTKIQTHKLPEPTLYILKKVFGSLPFKVLWKYDGEYINKPKNVFTTKWVPQQGVLAHHNIKLFIYQGGLQSTQEALHYGIPVIGMPFTFDQWGNVAKMVSMEIAKHMNINHLNENQLASAIREMAKSDRYKDRATEVGIIYRDKPFGSVWSAVWWIEYVLRHEGASHLRYSGANEPWYQRSDMDIVAFLAIIIFILISISFTLVCSYAIYACKRPRVRPKKMIKKKVH